LVYAGTGGPGKYNGRNCWDDSDTATWWLLEHNGRLVGVTALHTFRFAKFACIHIYINVNPLGNLQSERCYFHRQDSLREINEFVEVKLRKDLLLIRENYICDLFTTHNVDVVAENLDPDFQLHYAITCDIAFLDLEPHRKLFDAWPRCKLAASLPAVDDFDLAIGYNYGGRWGKTALLDEFAATVQPPNPGELYFVDSRSVSLGKVKAIGTGLLTDVSTMEEMSSGAPKFFLEGGELRVFGISVGSFYDAPEKSPDSWVLLDSTKEAHKLDLTFPEPGYSKKAASRNRNVILGIHHSCVKAMLDKI